MKTYIAAFLSFIFIAKFLAVDASGLNMLFGSSAIAFVNPNCNKKNDFKKLEESSNFSQQDMTSFQVLTLSSQCTTPFQLEFFSWEIDSSEPITFLNANFTSRLLRYRYLENVSPPPRWV